MTWKIRDRQDNVNHSTTGKQMTVFGSKKHDCVSFSAGYNLSSRDVTLQDCNKALLQLLFYFYNMGI